MLGQVENGSASAACVRRALPRRCEPAGHAAFHEHLARPPAAVVPAPQPTPALAEPPAALPDREHAALAVRFWARLERENLEDRTQARRAYAAGRCGPTRRMIDALA